MAKKSLRAQLNQIRAWVRQGRTDAWIAHQLEVPAAELREFKRRHDLAAGGEEPSETDLRDEIEAEIEAATLAEREAAEEEEREAAEEEEREAAEEEAEPVEVEEREAAEEEEREAAEEEAEPVEVEAEGEERAAEEEPGARPRGEGPEGAQRRRAARDEGGDEGDRPRRRRRRRGRRGRGRRKALEATFDHGEKEGYGLWLDPAVSDDPVYSEHWAGHRAVEVDVEPDRITIRRA